MENNEKAWKEKKFYEETSRVLNSGKQESVLLKIEELKESGTVKILPLLLALFEETRTEDIKKALLAFLSDLKDQHAVAVITDHIQKHSHSDRLSDLISACWQSSLDFSADIPVFTQCFITGNFSVAFESFTVIEEMLWRANAKTISQCRQMLTDCSDEISSDKNGLYTELIKLIDGGKSKNQEDFPELYN